MTVRDIQTVTTEIVMIRQQVNQVALNGAIEIGRRLTEAKEMLPHGEWGTWLKEKVEISPSAAQNFMKLFDEYGDAQITLLGAVAKSQTFGNLPYTKALRLLSIPESEREAFAEENDVANKSVREIDRLIRERDEARAKSEADRKRLEDVQNSIAGIRDQEKKAREEEADARRKLTQVQRELDEAKANEKRAKDELEKAKKNPTVPSAVLDKLRREEAEKAAQAAEKASRELEDRLRRAEREATEAMERAEKAAAQLEAAQKRAAAANPDVVVFATQFKKIQADYAELTATLLKVQAGDPDKANGLRTGVQAMLKGWLESVGA
jgi:myosin heavy subunit